MQEETNSLGYLVLSLPPLFLTIYHLQSQYCIFATTLKVDRTNSISANFKTKQAKPQNFTILPKDMQVLSS